MPRPWVGVVPVVHDTQVLRSTGGVGAVEAKVFRSPAVVLQAVVLA
jgi:hypothetical protein